MSAQREFMEEPDENGFLPPTEDEAREEAKRWPTVSAENARTSLKWALRYAAVGWYVFPIDLREGRRKKPAIKWSNGATNNPDEVRRLWQQFPGAPIGIACKRSGLVCVDQDKKNGKDGIAAFTKLMNGDYETKLVAKSPSGGQHCIYKADSAFEVRSRNNGLAPGIDIKAGGGDHGGYFVAPNGLDKRQWMHGAPDETKPPEMPGCLRDLLLSRERASAKTPAEVGGRSSDGAERVANDDVGLRGDHKEDVPELVEIDFLLLVSDALGTVPSDDRDVWRDMIFAVHAALRGHSLGIRLVRDWSNTAKRAEVRDPEEAERIYKKAKLPADSRASISASRLWATAFLCGFERAEAPVSLSEVQLAADIYRHSLDIDVDARLQNLAARVFDAFPLSADSASEHWRPFPLDALPPACRAIVEHGARAQGIDAAYWAVPMLGILAGCVGNARRVRVKPGWDEPAVLWTAIVAPSGTGKSPPLRELLLPVHKRDRELHGRTEAEQAFYLQALDAWKSDKSNGPKGPKPLPPPMLASIVDDATLEALIVRLQDNPRGLLLANDELATFLRSFDKYRGGGGDEQRWLSIHNADSVKVDRKSSPGGNPARVFVRHAAVSIVGTIQPGIAAKYLGAEEQRASGMSDRLLVAAPPTKAARWTDETVPVHVTDAWGRVVSLLLDLTHNNSDGGPQCLPLDPGARAAFIEFHDANGVACLDAATSGDADLAAALAKLRGAAARIALVLALARAAEDGRGEQLKSVDESSMRAGIALAQWFENEARGLYLDWSATARSLRDQSLDERILVALRARPRSRDELRNIFHRNVPASSIAQTLERLRGAGLVEMTREPTSGRPREVWRVPA